MSHEEMTGRTVAAVAIKIIELKIDNHRSQRCLLFLGNASRPDDLGAAAWRPPGRRAVLSQFESSPQRMCGSCDAAGRVAVFRGPGH